jgi:hypothetical protein
MSSPKLLDLAHPPGVQDNCLFTTQDPDIGFRFFDEVFAWVLDKLQAYHKTIMTYIVPRTAPDFDKVSDIETHEVFQQRVLLKEILWKKRDFISSCSTFSQGLVEVRRRNFRTRINPPQGIHSSL